MRRNKTHPAESGNALFIILIGVVLFAALAFTFTRGGQQGGETISARQAELATSDIVTFAQRTGRAVDGMLRAGKSETDISFEGLSGPYTNAACTDDTCKIFTGNTGGIQPVYPVSTWLDPIHAASYAYLNWYITSQICVPGLPDNTCAVPKGNDLVMVLPYLRQIICEKINEKLALPIPVPVPSTFIDLNIGKQFSGTYAPNGGAVLLDTASLSGKSAGCLFDANTNAYYFYQVLIAR